MAANEIHVGDVGTIIEVTFYDETGAVLDISTATEKKIAFKKTDGTVDNYVLLFVTDGTDGKAKYVSIAATFDMVGGWSNQGRVALPTGTWHSDIHEFEVHESYSFT